jgi:hypothetical protein
LRPAVTYVITVEGEAVAEGEGEPEVVYPLTALGRLAMDIGVEDFAARHGWYAHGRLPDDEP